MSEQVSNMEEESRGLSFKDILFIIRKHILAIIAFVAACTVAGIVFNFVEPPTYESTGTMLVSYEGQSGQINTDYTFSNYISNTYVVFIKEDIVLEKVATATNIPLGTLRSNTSVSNSSLVIKVTYKDRDRQVAQDVVNVIIDTAQEVADTTINEGGVDKPLYHLLYDNLKVLSPAKPGTKHSNAVRNVGIGFGAGVVLAFIYVVLKQSFDNTFKSTDEVERLLDIPVIAGIPEYEFADEKNNKRKGGK